MKSLLTFMAIVATAGLIYAHGKHEEQGHHGESAMKSEKVETKASNPVNDICPVMGNKVDPKITVEYKGETIGLCCNACVKMFKKNPEKYMKKLERRKKVSAKPINDICPVMGNKVNPKITVEYKGKTIGLCCNACVKMFKKNPDKYMKKLLKEKK